MIYNLQGKLVQEEKASSGVETTFELPNPKECTFYRFDLKMEQ